MFFLLAIFAFLIHLEVAGALDPSQTLKGIRISLLEDHCNGLYGNEVAKKVQPYANLYNAAGKSTNGIEQIIKKTSTPEHLLTFAALALETQERPLFRACIKQLNAVDPNSINHYFTMGRTLPLALLITNRPSYDMFNDLMDVFGTALDINLGTKDDGATILFLLSQENKLDLVDKVLLSRDDVNVTAARADGCCPHAIAAEFGHLCVIEKLYTYASNHNQTIDINAHSGRDGTTPLIASIGNKVDPVTGKIIQIADVVAETLIEKYGAKVDEPVTKTGASPLFIAASYQKLNLHKFLIEHGATINHQTKAGHTVLHALVCHANIASKPTNNALESFFRTVLTSNPELWTKCSDFGYAPLHDAVETGYSISTLLNIIKKLRIDDYPNVLTTTNRSALHLAAALNNKEVVKILLDHNINSKIKDQNQETAADIAHNFGHYVIEQLIRDKMQSEKEKQAKKRKKRKKAPQLAASTAEITCPQCGTLDPYCTCTSSSANSLTPLNPEKKPVQHVPSKKTFVKANATEFFSFLNLSAPDKICAMRNIDKDGRTRNVLIGYKQRNESADLEDTLELIYKCNMKEYNEQDTYHSTHRAFDKKIIAHGIRVTYEEQAAYKELLETYRITIHPGCTAYILPGLIASSAYDPKLALAHRGRVNPLGGKHDHEGAFVLIAMNDNSKQDEKREISIGHKCFHPSKEQREAEH